MWAIIGGSGFEKFEDFKPLEDLSRETPFGMASLGFKKVSLEGKELLFIPRHGTDHGLLPSEVNYRANIFALKKYGATKLLTFSAVGSLQNELAPGDLVVPNQFIDRTKGRRPSSFCGEGIVGHVSLAEPISAQMMEGLKELVGEQEISAAAALGRDIPAVVGCGKNFDFKVHFDRTLVVMEGPQFSTKAESHLYRSWGADIIGMTSYPEYALAREAGLAFLNCCFVTDYDCWKDDIPHVTVEQVIKVMKLNNQKAYQVARSMLHSQQACLVEASETDNGLKTALMSDPNQMSLLQKDFIEVLTR
jgi:5'-methylthioadenosine phosphorylase